MFCAGDPQVINPSPPRVGLFRCQGESDHRTWFVPREVTLPTVDSAQELNDQYNEAARQLALTIQGYTACYCLQWLSKASQGFTYRPVRAASPSKAEKEHDPLFAPDERGDITRLALFEGLTAVALIGPVPSMRARDVSIPLLPGEPPAETARRFVVEAEQNCSQFNTHRNVANEYCLNFTGEFQNPSSSALSTPKMENFYVGSAHSKAATPKP